MIKALSFDFDDTLAGNFPPVHIAFHSILRSQGYKIKEELIEKAFRETMKQMKTDPEIMEKTAKYATYSLKERKMFYTDINLLRLESLGINEDKLPLRQLAGIITETFPGKTEKRLFDDVPETLLELKLFHENIDVYIISGNRKSYIKRFLGDEGLIPYIKGILTPERKGLSKKTILFDHVLKKTGINPRQWLHVGDDYYTDYLYPFHKKIRALLLHRPGILHLKVPEEKREEVQVITQLKEIYDYL
ncbi:MAG: HAD family hydrolase [Candidatus Hodarchaeales archaeon]